MLVAIVLSQPALAQERYGLVIVIDGARGDLFLENAQRGLMPNVQKTFVDQGLWVRKATSVFPTITGAGMPSVLTGCLPGRHGIPSLYFFSRSERAYPVLYTPLEAIFWDQWLSPDVKTIWEYFPGRDDAISIGPAMHRGSDDHISFLWNAGYKALELRGQLKLGMRDLKRRILGREPARLSVVYSGWFDHMEHVNGSEGPDIEAQYRKVDHLIGVSIDSFQKVIERRRQEVGAVESFITLVSDHGHQDVKEVISIEEHIREKRGARVLDKIWSRLFGFKLGGWLPKDFSDREIVVASGEGHALLYLPTPLVDPDTGVVTSLDWDTKPSLEVLRNYPFRNGQIDLIAEATASRATGFAMSRDLNTGDVHIFSGSGHSAISREGTFMKDSTYAYSVLEGEDPLGYASNPDVIHLVDSGYHDQRTWYDATIESPFPDAIVQLSQAFDVTKRCPDIYISAAPYISIGDLVDGEKSRSKHGGLTVEEAWSTLAFSGDGIEPGMVDHARIIDMVPSMLHLLDVDYDPNGLDGDVLPELQMMVNR